MNAIKCSTLLVYVALVQISYSPIAACVSKNKCLANAVNLVNELESKYWRNHFFAEIAEEYANDARFDMAIQCMSKISDANLLKNTSLNVARRQVEAGRDSDALNTLREFVKNYDDLQIKADCLAEIGLHIQAMQFNESHKLRVSPVCLARLARVEDAFCALLVSEHAVTETNNELAELGAVCIETRQFQELKDGYELLLGDRAEMGLAWLLLTKLIHLSQKDFAAVVKELKLDNRFPILVKRPFDAISPNFVHNDYRIQRTLCETDETSVLENQIRQAAIEALKKNAELSTELLAQAVNNLPPKVTFNFTDSFCDDYELSMLKVKAIYVQALNGDITAAHEIKESIVGNSVSVAHVNLARLIGSALTEPSLNSFLSECSRLGLPKEVSIALILGAVHKNQVRPFESLRIWQRITAGKMFQSQLQTIGTESVTTGMIPLFCDSSPVFLQRFFFDECDKSAANEIRSLRFLRCAPPQACSSKVLMKCLDSVNPKIVLNAIVRVIDDEIDYDLSYVEAKMNPLLFHHDADIRYTAENLLRSIRARR